MKKKFLFLLLISGFAISVYSQQTIENPEDTIQISEVVVTGSPVKINRNNIPMAVSVVTNQQISESVESALLPALSGRVPGLFVTERGVTGFGVSTGSAGQITMRGIGGNPTTGVLILIDGHPQFMGIFGHPLSDSYVASDVEKVEIIRGPASILYGTNAMGGVINIITKKQHQEGFTGNARMIYGSFNTQKYMAAAGYRKKNFSLMASINHDQTNGHRDNSDFKITNGYLKTGYTLNNHIKVNADFSLAAFNATDPGPDTINAVKGNTIDITRGYWAVALDNEYENYSGTLKFFYNFGEHNISDGFYSTDANYGINLFEAFKFFKGNNFTFGADYMNYGGKAENIHSEMIFTDTTLYEVGIFGFIQQEFFGKLTLNTGVRLQNHEVYGSEWIPSGGFAWRIFENTNWKANVSKGFRSPTIRELFMWNHNAALKPENIMNYETGIIQSFFNRSFSFEITGYLIKGDNLIVTGDMGRLYNTGKIENRGIEFAATIKPVKNIEINASYSYINMKYAVYATPENQFFLSANYQIKKLAISATLQQVSGLDTDPSASINTHENYTLLGAKANYKIMKYITVFISTENLLNQKYETVHYYTMPGITVFAGITLKKE